MIILIKTIRIGFKKEKEKTSRNKGDYLFNIIKGVTRETKKKSCGRTKEIILGEFEKR